MMSEDDYLKLLSVAFDQTRTVSETEKTAAMVKIGARVLANLELIARGESKSFVQMNTEG